MIKRKKQVKQNMGWKRINATAVTSDTTFKVIWEKFKRTPGRKSLRSPQVSNFGNFWTER